ncbi:ABC transporter permease [Sinorhizobium meliloti]|jgi:simple sugar transport system permease protein/ribose transport system permease protein|uniref:ABC transporter permease n=1 Tax=Rhizobium meliloti TaxID=382 RepID=UPI0020BDC2A7|nr:ABC transporter permease [Sinorhizobium meliloti]
MALSIAKPVIRRHAEIGIFLIGAILVVIFASTSDGKWANLYNIGTILQVTATLGLMSLGVALVIGTGEIDISVGSTFGMGALAYLWLAAHVDPSLAAVAAIVVGAATGLVNGLLVTRTGTPSLIITLGTLMIFRGIAIALTEGFSFSVPYAARKGWAYFGLGGGEFFGFNTALYWLIIVLVILMAMLKAMPFGNRLLAVGGSAESAHSRGVRVGRVKLSAFVLCGVLAAFAGTLEAGKLGFADGSMGRLMELQAIASCVLGGCLLAGGRVSLIGALMGAFVLSSIQSYLVVTGVRPQWFILILGLIVVIAAYGDRSLRQWALRK